MSIGYWGSKKRFASEIVDVLERHGGKRVTLYEPFCGMASVGMEALRRDVFRKVAFTDVNENVVAYWHGVARGWLPSGKPLTDAEWSTLKASTRPSVRRSFYGFHLGFGGHFLAGRFPCADMNRPSYQERARERLRTAFNMLKERSGAWEVALLRYEDLRPSKNSVIYCDPPYVVSTTDGGRANRKQHFSENEMARLWECMRRWIAERGCVVFLSAARPPKPPRGVRLTVVKKWEVSNRIQTSKTGSGRRTEVLLRVTLGPKTSPKRSSRKHSSRKRS